MKPANFKLGFRRELEIRGFVFRKEKGREIAELGDISVKATRHGPGVYFNGHAHPTARDSIQSVDKLIEGLCPCCSTELYDGRCLKCAEDERRLARKLQDVINGAFGR